jgi:uridylate kinase
MDMLLTVGERISMALLSMALADRKVQAVSLTGSQSGIITDASHRRARIRRILGDRVRAGLAEGKVVIVAGFQGVSESKEITTLGRGGSDTTAVALAASLQAESCDIYTDVDGVYSADPRKVTAARFWREMPADLMAAKVDDVIAAVRQPLLEQFHCFDVFCDPTGQKLDASRKSMAYRFHYRAADRTLKAEEVDAAHATILEKLLKELPVHFR